MNQRYGSFCHPKQAGCSPFIFPLGSILLFCITLLNVLPEPSFIWSTPVSGPLANCTPPPVFFFNTRRFASAKLESCAPRLTPRGFAFLLICFFGHFEAGHGSPDLSFVPLDSFGPLSFSPPPGFFQPESVASFFKLCKVLADVLLQPLRL